MTGNNDDKLVDIEELRHHKEVKDSISRSYSGLRERCKKDFDSQDPIKFLTDFEKSVLKVFEEGRVTADKVKEHCAKVEGLPPAYVYRCYFDDEDPDSVFQSLVE